MHCEISVGIFAVKTSAISFPVVFPRTHLWCGGKDSLEIEFLNNFYWLLENNDRYCLSTAKENPSEINMCCQRCCIRLKFIANSTIISWTHLSEAEKWGIYHTQLITAINDGFYTFVFTWKTVTVNEMPCRWPRMSYEGKWRKRRPKINQSLVNPSVTPRSMTGVIPRACISRRVFREGMFPQKISNIAGPLE